MARRPVGERLMWTPGCRSREGGAGNSGNKPAPTVPNSPSRLLLSLGIWWQLVGLLQFVGEKDETYN